jgi:autotransporter strand-loop-strand O-heptosyltransferase
MGLKRKILIEAKNLSLGHTIASMPYISKFAEVNKMDKIFVAIKKDLIPFFNPTYNNFEYLTDSEGDDIFDAIIPLEFNNYNKSIQQEYAEKLGFINASYIRPRISIPDQERPIKNKYVILGVHSTSQLKYWNHPRGKRVQLESPYWNELCRMLRKEGYTPVTIERDELFGVLPHRNGLPSKSNNKIGTTLLDSVNLINHCEFFIGLSSGMTWLAHALGKKVAMISNFTEDWTEFDLSLDDYIRITNKSVCHGCWNRINTEYLFDRHDWYWCPRHKDTERQFECHTSITPEQVFNEIKKWI